MIFTKLVNQNALYISTQFHLKIHDRLSEFANPSRGPSGALLTARSGVLALFLIVFTGVYFFFATQLINQTNHNRQRSDQQNNIEHTRVAISHMRPDISDGFGTGIWRWFPHYTDGVVNPLWPWLSARFQDNKPNSDQDIFVRGKWINVTMTAAFCVLCGLIAARHFSLLASMNLVLVIGFGALLPQAVFYQPEPMYFILFCLSWLMCLRIFHRNTVWCYGLLGVLCGLSYLAKTSIQPLMISFVLVTSYRFLLDAGVHVLKVKWHRPCSEFLWQRHVVGMAFFVTLFLVTAGPRLSYAHDRFGSAFHSYPSYWMWMDDFNTGAAFMQEYSEKEKLTAIPKEEKPSLHKYMETHDATEFRNRLTDGFWWTTHNLLDPKEASVKEGKPSPWRTLLPDRGGYLLFLIAALAAIIVWSRAQRPKPDQPIAFHTAREGSTAALFVIGCTLTYGLAYGWYVPVGKGDRFMLSLYAPLIFSVMWALESMVNRLSLRTGRPFAWMLHQGVQLVLLGLVIARLAQMFAAPYFYTK